MTYDVAKGKLLWVVPDKSSFARPALVDRQLGAEGEVLCTGFQSSDIQHRYSKIAEQTSTSPLEGGIVSLNENDVLVTYLVKHVDAVKGVVIVSPVSDTVKYLLKTEDIGAVWFETKEEAESQAFSNHHTISYGGKIGYSK
jgi:hypothetical protein